MPLRMSTNDVDSPDRVAYWTDMVCDTYVRLDCDPGPGHEDIQGEILVERLAAIELSRVTSTAQRVSRTPARISASAEDFFLVSIQTEGRGRVLQDGRCAELSPGDYALYDSTRPYQLHFDTDFQQYVLMLPRTVLQAVVRNTEALTASTMSGQRGAGPLMINMIRTLAGSIDSLAPASAGAVADSVTQILVAGLSSLPAALQSQPSQLTRFHREQIRAYLNAHLGDPQLGVNSIAAALKVSPSTVHRAWAGEACTLADTIRNARLDACRRALADPAQALRGISEIAFEHGFSDAAHFSRSFRARFDCAPREIRPRRGET
ncbi:MAG: helix-turn-helix domain-containing protein [Lautropia sp.]